MYPITRRQSLLILLLIAVLSLSLSGCGSDAIQDDLVDYLNVKAPPLIKEEIRINEDFASVAGKNYTDDATMYAMLTDNVIPDTKVLIKDLEKMDLKTVEVRNVHQKWIDAEKTRLNSFETLKTALEDANSAGVDKSNEYYDKASALDKEHEDAIASLAKAHNVELTTK